MTCIIDLVDIFQVLPVDKRRNSSDVLIIQKKFQATDVKYLFLFVDLIIHPHMNINFCKIRETKTHRKSESCLE